MSATHENDPDTLVCQGITFRKGYPDSEGFWLWKPGVHSDAMPVTVHAVSSWKVFGYWCKLVPETPAPKTEGNTQA